MVAFPGLAHFTGNAWALDVHLWVFEPEPNSLRRAALTRAMRAALGVNDGDPGEELLKERLLPFLVDNESGQAITVRIAEQLYLLPASAVDGHATLRVRVPVEAVPASGGVVPLEVLTRPGDERRFESKAHFVPPEGRLLVSDIDDTVKITEVTDRRRMLKRTFVEPFAFVPGAAEAYRARLEGGGHLHFLSSSPSQLYTFLQAGLTEAGFAPATFDLKRWRPAGLDLSGLLSDPKQSKGAALEALAQRFPRRRFYLVGDSGERDPEIYGDFARQHPNLVEQIAIRDVTGSRRDDRRYTLAFHGMPPERWHVVTSPSELPR